MADIFISYAREDEEQAKHLAAALQTRGWSVWCDQEIPVGKVFHKVIDKELKAARCIVVLWSEAATESEWVEAEASEGKKREILIPAYIGKVETDSIPLLFRKLNAVDLTEWYGSDESQAFNKLVEAISGHVGPPPSELQAEHRPEDAANGDAQKERPRHAEEATRKHGKEQLDRARIQNNIELNWLVEEIHGMKCTPILGALARTPSLPAVSDLADKLVNDKEFPPYPFKDDKDFARITKYAYVMKKGKWTRGRVQRALSEPRFSVNTGDSQIIYTLAKLPIPLYITTNYDDHLFEALKSLGKTPCRIIPNWRKALFEVLQPNTNIDKYDERDKTSIEIDPEDKSTYTAENDPTETLDKDNPIVFHMNGCAKYPLSMVISEDDQLDFLVAMVGQKDFPESKTDKNRMFPYYVRNALGSNTLLLLGYRLYDWSFRIITRLFRLYSIRSEGTLVDDDRSHRMIQTMLIRESDEDAVYGEKYISSYLRKTGLGVYWVDDIPTFSKDLARTVRGRNISAP